MDPWLLSQVRLAERRGILTGKQLSEVQVFALELLAFQEWVDKQNADPSVLTLRRNLSEGAYDDPPTTTSHSAEEDLSAVQWQSPSDNEGVMKEIEMFNQAMAANAHVVVDDEGGWI